MKLRYTPRALFELNEILDHIAGRSPKGAERVGARLREAIECLVDHPRRGQATRRSGLHRLVVRPFPYLVYYLVADGEIVVIALRHAARDPSSMPDWT